MSPKPHSDRENVASKQGPFDSVTTEILAFMNQTSIALTAPQIMCRFIHFPPLSFSNGNKKAGFQDSEVYYSEVLFLVLRITFCEVFRRDSAI